MLHGLFLLHIDSGDRLDPSVLQRYTAAATATAWQAGHRVAGFHCAAEETLLPAVKMMKFWTPAAVQ